MAKDPSELGPQQGNLFGTRRQPDAKAPATEAAASVSTEAGMVDRRAPRPLWIGPEQKAAIAALIAKAGGERVGLEDMKRRAQALQRGIPVPKSYNRPFTIPIPYGFTVTYTVEEQPQSWTRHLSIAADRGGRVPHPAAVEMLMREFGFHAASMRQLGDRGGALWLEPIGNDRQAVNVVEYIEATATPAGGAEDYIPDPDQEPPEE